MGLNAAQVQQAYVTFFNRPADTAGLAYWQGYGGSLADLYHTFARQTEYTALYAGLSGSAIIDKVYQNLFGHPADAAGAEYWCSALDTGLLQIGTIANAISYGAQGSDASTLSGKVAAATAFTGSLDSHTATLYATNAQTVDAVRNWLATVGSSTADSTVPYASGWTLENLRPEGNIVLAFDELIRAGSGSIELHSGSKDGPLVESFDVASSARLGFALNTLTLDPASMLAAGTDYYVVLPAGSITDMAGNSPNYPNYPVIPMQTPLSAWAAEVYYFVRDADNGAGWPVAYDLSFDGSQFHVTTRIDLTGAEPGTLPARWENGIESSWNGFALQSGGNTYAVVFDVRFVADGQQEHYDVEVVSGAGRDRMLAWYTEKQGWGDGYQELIAAHEYGHMLGCYDEYAGGGIWQGYTTTGTLMSDLTDNLPVSYLSGIERYAENLTGLAFAIVGQAATPDMLA